MTFLEVGRVIGYAVMWLVLVPVGLCVTWRAAIGMWNLALAAVELFAALLGALLVIAWQPIGWAVVWAEGVVSRVRARWAA